MKQIIILIIFIFFGTQSYCQYSEHSKEYYQQKSISRKAIGWIVLSLGVGTTAIALSSWGNDNDAFINLAPGLFTIVGVGVAASSLSLFKSAKKYKRLAAALSFGKQKVPYPTQNSMVFKMQTAVTLKLGL